MLLRKEAPRRVIQTQIRRHREKQGMVTASKREVVIQATREEEVAVVTMTPPRLQVVGATTKTPTTPLTPGTQAKKMMTQSLKRSAVTEG